MIDRDELGAWLRLLETPLVGRDSARKLLAAFGSPQAVIEATTSARRTLVGANPTAALASCPDGVASRVQSTLAWLTAEAAEPRAIVTLGDPHYPRALLASADPPLLLYAQGRLDLLQADSIAVVGSCNPTPQGHDNARAFSSHLSHAGFTIVSGLALGVDAAAHAGGLEGAASTIAVVGTGLDRVYPRRNLSLAHRIVANGLMVSEYSLCTPPLQANFPLRKRIIAGLTRGTLVVEAALQSGSLITARLAVEAGREVFAIPGSIHSPLSRGCHALLKQGAKLVETAQDILEELQLTTAGASVVKAARTGTDHIRTGRRCRLLARRARVRPGHARRAGCPHRVAGVGAEFAPAPPGTRRTGFAAAARPPVPAHRGARLKRTGMAIVPQSPRRCAQPAAV